MVFPEVLFTSQNIINIHIFISKEEFVIQQYWPSHDANSFGRASSFSVHFTNTCSLSSSLASTKHDLASISPDIWSPSYDQLFNDVSTNSFYIHIHNYISNKVYVIPTPCVSHASGILNLQTFWCYLTWELFVKYHFYCSFYLLFFNLYKLCHS